MVTNSRGEDKGGGSNVLSTTRTSNCLTKGRKTTAPLKIISKLMNLKIAATKNHIVISYLCDFYSRNSQKQSGSSKKWHFSTSRVVRFDVFHFQAYSRKIRGGRPSDELIYIIFFMLTPAHFEILAPSVVDGTPYYFGEIHPFGTFSR